MADSIEIGHPKDVSARKGQEIKNTGSLRRTYNKREKKSGVNFRICNNKYVAGK